MTDAMSTIRTVRCPCYYDGKHIHLECIPAVRDARRTCGCKIGEDACFTCGGPLVQGVNSDFCSQNCEDWHAWYEEREGPPPYDAATATGMYDHDDGV